MPIKRSATVMRLSDLEFWERFALCAGCWSPDHTDGTRWRTWAEYFATYSLVRAELLAERQDQGRWPPMAEFSMACYLAGKDPMKGRLAYDKAVEAWTTRPPRRQRGEQRHETH